MKTDPAPRHPREALDLTVRVVALRRGGANHPALLAAVDQARASLLREPDLSVRRTLSWVCRQVLGPGPEAGGEATVVDAALWLTARALTASADGDA